MTLESIPKYCITLPERPARTEAAKNHFNDMGLLGVQFVDGIYADAFGLLTKNPYEVDNPGSGFNIGPHCVGIWLSHWMLWQYCLLSHDYMMILEDDAKLLPGWKARVEQALKDVPSDMEWLFLGSCCAKGAQKTKIKGEVFEVKWPVCNHWYIISRAGAKKLLATQRKVYAPIDISTLFHSFPKMRVYTVLPRVADQFNTEILD